MDIAEFSVKRPVDTWMRILIFVMLGAIAYTQLNTELLPDVERPSLFVSTQWSGVSPEDMESQITTVVEDAVATVPGLLHLSSRTSEGSSRVTVEFEPGHDMRQAAVDVLQYIQKAQRKFQTSDPNLLAPSVQQHDPNSMPVLVLGVSGINDPVRFRTVLNDEIKPVFESAAGVASAEVNGGQERAIMVEFDSQALLAHSLTSQDLVKALSSENQNVAGGMATNGNKQMLVRSYGWVKSLKELEAIPVGTSNGRLIPLKRVARTTDSHTETTNYQRLNGVPAGSINILKQSNANTVDTVNNALAKLEEIKRNHPDLQFREVYNQSKFVSQAVTSLEEAGLVGGALAMMVVFFFLRNFRTTLVVATSIPVSIISTFSFLYIMDYSLNTMSLVGLALATGLIVDDAVVVMESIYRQMEEKGLGPVEASIVGTKVIMSAVLSSTFTIMVVFFPLLLIPGQTGQMFRPFALVIIMAMAFSLLDALTGVPMLCSQFIRIVERNEEDQPRATFWDRMFARWEGWAKALDAGYADLLRSAMRRRALVLIAGVVVTVVSLGLIPLIGFDFMPGSDTGTLRLQLNMPRGTALVETDAAMAQIERVIASQPDVVTYLTSVGQGSGGGGSRDTGSAWISLRENRRRASCDAVSARLLAGFANIPAVRAFPSTMDTVKTTISGGSQGQSLELDIFGADQVQLTQLSQQFLAILKDVPGCGDLRDQAGDPAPEIRWIVDREKATDLGLTFFQVASAIQTASQGVTASYFQSQGKRAPIVVQLAQEKRDATVDLVGLVVNSKVASSVQNGTTGTRENASKGVQLGQVARAETALGFTTINRLARQRYRALVGAGQGRALSAIQKDVEAALADFAMPPGYSWDWSTSSKSQGQQFRKLGFAVILAIVLIYMLLCIQFENLIVPLSIILSVPLCIVGVLLALFLTARPFSVMAGVGCLMLVGIAVKNGILLIDNTLRAREAGMAREEALLYACPERLRPILITAFAAMLAMLPIAMRGRGGEMESPMAIAVVGGLLASTLLTLFIVPMAYLTLDDLDTRFFRRPVPSGEGGPHA